MFFVNMNIFANNKHLINIFGNINRKQKAHKLQEDN